MEARTITFEEIESYVQNSYTFSAYDGAALLDIEPEEELKLLTICVVVLKNGFTLLGQSACADPRKFDPVLGAQLAKKDALQKAWPLMGYVLRSHLAGMSGLLEGDYKDRAKLEYEQLSQKMGKLAKFLEGDYPLTEEQRNLLNEQWDGMIIYQNALRKRIEAF